MINILILPWMEEHPILGYVTSWFTLPASVAATIIAILAAIEGSFIFSLLTILIAADLGSYAIQFIIK